MRSASLLRVSGAREKRPEEEMTLRVNHGRSLAEYSISNSSLKTTGRGNGGKERERGENLGSVTGSRAARAKLLTLSGRREEEG